MNRTDVESLTPVELRLAVAQYVMGYRVEIVKPEWYQHEVYCIYDPQFPPHMTYAWDQNACNAMMYRNGKDLADGTVPPLPSYEAEDSEGAEYQVIDRMISLRYHFRLYGYDVSHRGGGQLREFEAEFLPIGSNLRTRHIAAGACPQLAISRAALLAQVARLPMLRPRVTLVGGGV